jgi:hypothetical protein
MKETDSEPSEQIGIPLTIRFKSYKFEMDVSLLA